MSRRAQILSGLDRLPPNDIESEQGVLSCMLQSPEACASAISLVVLDDFYDLRHAALFTILVEMFMANTPIDSITVSSALKASDQLEGIGGIMYLLALQDAVPSAANIRHYAENVKEKAKLRKIIQSCTHLVAEVYEGKSLDEVQSKASEVMLDTASDQSHVYGAKDLVLKALGEIEEDYGRQGKLSGIASGFTDLDQMTWGFQNGDMIVVAARQSMGKSALTMNFVEHAAVELGLPVGVFSFEMSGQSLMKRMICSRARLNIRNVRSGFLAERDFPKLTGAAGKISSAKIHVCDQPSMSINQLAAKARQFASQFGIKFMVIDYLQCLSGSKEKRNDEVAEISRGIKRIARDLQIPVLAISSLNRESEKGKGGSRRPRLSDISQSGQIEYEADLVALLYRAENDEDKDEYENQDAVAMNLEIAKQRNGPTGIVRLTFLKCFTRFESASRISCDDVPEARETKQPYND